jgi:hypothetical protein
MVALISIAINKPNVSDTYVVIPKNMQSFKDSAVAVSSIILAFNGHIAYPTIISEMKEPRDFPKALILLESVTITFYIIVAVVIYHFAGQSVQSPALGSASPLVRKIAYGFALPTIVVAGVIVGIVLAKQLFASAWSRQPDVIEERSWRANLSWAGILAAAWSLAFMIANVIPIFMQLLGLVGAAFGTWFALGFCSLLWLSMNKGQYRKNWKKVAMTALNVFIVVACTACVSDCLGSLSSRGLLTAL